MPNDTPPGDQLPDAEKLMDIGLKQQKSSGHSAWSAPALGDLPVIPNLQVEALIGIGGMGAVYRARQTHIDRPVALKVLDPARSSDRTFAERFTREARAMARLDHPAIVRLYDFGQSGSWLWLTMELVEGATLRDIIRTGNLSPQESLNLALQLCEAVSHAHGAGVIHRDLKPENILIDGHGRPKIADFGLAKLNSELHGHTTTGAVMGTAVYMAPEQIAGDEIDHRADIYTMGVVLYEMFTGLQPLGRFAMPSRSQGIDPRLDEVVLKCLERDPLRRWKTAGDLRRALQDATSAETDSPRKMEWEWSGAKRKGWRNSTSPGIHMTIDDDHHEKRSGFPGIRINADGVTIGDVAVGKSGQRGNDDQADGNDGVRSCYNGGMFLLIVGCLIGVFRFLNHDPVDLPRSNVGMVGALFMVVGGISLLTRSGMVLAIVGGIGAFITVPWIWHEHTVLGICALLAYLAIVPRNLRMHRLRRHYASISNHSRFWHWSFAVILSVAVILLMSSVLAASRMGRVGGDHDAPRNLTVLAPAPSPDDLIAWANPQVLESTREHPRHTVRQETPGLVTYNPLLTLEGSHLASGSAMSPARLKVTVQSKNLQGEAYFEVLTRFTDGSFSVDRSRHIDRRIDAFGSPSSIKPSGDGSQVVELPLGDWDSAPGRVVASVTLCLVMHGTGLVQLDYHISNDADKVPFDSSAPIWTR